VTGAVGGSARARDDRAGRSRACAACVRRGSRSWSGPGVRSARVRTRVAASFYGFEPSYEKIISGLIAGGSQGWQVALLAPGWVHGCLGLWIALRHFAVMQRIRPALIGVLIAVPLLSAVGFLRMSVDVEAREATVSAHASEQKRRAAPLAQWRHALLTIYLLTVAGAFAAGRWRARYIPE